MLARKDMEQVIMAGGSVLLPDGRLITNVSNLPSAAELAKGDPAREAAAAVDLQTQINELQRQLAALQNDPATGTQDSDKKVVKA